MTTTGNQTYTGAVVLTGAGSVLTASAGDIGIEGALDSEAGEANALTLSASGAVGVAGSAGAATGGSLGSLTASAERIGLGSVRTDGSQTYTGTTTLSGVYAISDTVGSPAFAVNGPSILAGDVVISNGALSGSSPGSSAATVHFGRTGMADTLEGSGRGLESLTIASTAAVAFHGAVGASVPLEAVSVTGGTIALRDVSSIGGADLHRLDYREQQLCDRRGPGHV